MIDVSELMDDPDFLDPNGISVERRAVGVNAHGENNLTPRTFPGVAAIVQNGAGDMLERLPEAARYKESISIWCRFELQAEAPGVYADVVTWRGRRYQVALRDNWTNWGDGYTRVVATLQGVSV